MNVPLGEDDILDNSIEASLFWREEKGGGRREGKRETVAVVVRDNAPYLYACRSGMSYDWDAMAHWVRIRCRHYFVIVPGVRSHVYISDPQL